MTKVVAERRGAAAAAAAMDGYKVLHSMLRGEYTEESNGARTIRQSGGKDRHSKVFTSRGPRDRRVRLSVATAIRFYDLQDRLGFDQPSKAVEWLLLHSQPAIQTLPQLGLHHLHPPPPPPPNPPPNSPLLPSLTSNLLPPLPLASLNHPLISNLNPPLDPDHINDPSHTHHALNTICHATHAQDCEDHPPHAININHHTPWPSNPTPNPILKHTSCPNLIPNPPQTSLEDDPQYSNYSSASSGAPIRLSSSPPNPTALQLHHNKRKRSTQSPTNHHHQFSISDLQDDYTCSSNLTSHEPYLPAQRLTIFNEAPMNYCSTSEYNNNNINNNIPSNNNWLPSQDQLNAHTHHHHQFPTNNAIQLYNNHEDNTRLASFDEPNLAESHLIISQQVTNSLAHESCDMQQIAPQQLDELDYGVPSPSESTSMKASCCKGMQESKYTNGYGGGQPGTTGNYNCVSSASSATSNVVETNAFSGWAISNAGSSYRQTKFQYNSTDQI